MARDKGQPLANNVWRDGYSLVAVPQLLSLFSVKHAQGSIGCDHRVMSL